MENEEIVEVICNKCGYNKSKVIRLDNVEGGECLKCGNLTFYKRTGPIAEPFKPTVKCPYCGSTNTKKISFGTKAAHTALFGVFAVGKVSKEWHCNNCKSDF